MPLAMRPTWNKQIKHLPFENPCKIDFDIWDNEQYSLR